MADEILKAIKDLPSGKTPGLDGFSPEFYLHFWPQLKNNFLRMTADVFITEELTIDQKRGVITLIPKQKKDSKYIGNWRPISILNCDYKILTKILANRLKPLLSDLIKEDQNGFVLHRLIGHNIRMVKDIMDICAAQRVDGLLVLLDFEKAFDTLSWPFIHYTLEQFGFGPNFIRWIDILYTDIESSVINNGHISSSFKLARGIRQGCPISAFIFILCAEMLANKMRDDQKIEGINLGNNCYKILQFADDTALIIKNVESLERSLKVLDMFYKVSGLRLNKAKTIVTKLGKKNNTVISEALVNLNLKLCEESFKYLGIWFDMDSNIMEYKNYRHRIEKIENLLKIWRQRDLSLKGKVTVLKSLALSQLVYPLSVLAAPKWVIKEANKLFYKFLWNDKNDKINRDTVEKKIDDGGLKMINIEVLTKSLRIRTVKNIYNNLDSKWSHIPKLYFTDFKFEDVCHCRCLLSWLPPFLPDYYKELIMGLMELKSKEPDSFAEICNESLWFNKFITIKKEPLFVERWYDAGVRKIGDLLDKEGNFISSDDIKKRFNIKHCGFLEYYSIRQSIPYSWKIILRKKGTKIVDSNKLYIYVNGEYESLNRCGKKDIYWELLRIAHKKPVRAFEFWTNLLDLPVESIKKFLYIPYQAVRDCKIQSLQYKIFHNIYICRKKLFQWKLENDDICLDCNMVDDIPHHFLGCSIMKGFWNSMSVWWKGICQCHSFNDVSDILLGINQRVCHRDQLNFIILKAKWYVYRTKYNGDRISVTDFLPELKREIDMEEYISRKNNKYEKFYTKWYDIQTEL
jgi:hypothetical protein